MSSTTTPSTATPSTTTSSSTITTTTTLADEPPPTPPKPDGEPEIDLLPVATLGTVVYDPTAGEEPASYFAFETASGSDSYTVTAFRSYLTANESGSFTQQSRVDGSFLYFAGTEGTGDIGEAYELIVAAESQELESWARVHGEWTSVEGDYLGIVMLSQILPDVTQETLYDTFATMQFADWDLIDGAWYARYTASPEFVVAGLVASLGYDEDDEALVDTAGDVWVSTLGFMHSYEISATGEEGTVVESTWRLSDLGSTSVQIPGS